MAVHYNGKLKKKNKIKCDKLVENILKQTTYVGDEYSKSEKNLKEGFALFEDLMILQTNGLLSNSSKYKKIAEFCLLYGLSNIEIKESLYKGLGVFASKEFKEAEIICTLNKSGFITSTSNESLNMLYKKDNLLFKMQNVALSLNLMQEIVANYSSLQPYLDILPKTFNTPLYLSFEDINMCQNLIGFEDIYKHINSIARQYAYIYLKMENNKDWSCFAFKDKFTYQNYRWAVSCVSTRQNRIPESNTIFEDKNYTLALIPLFDMFNHDGTLPMSIDYDTDRHEVIVYAPKSYKAGDEIFINYGNRSSLQYFIHNGFVPTVNPHNYIVLKFGLKSGDPIFARKLEWIKSLLDDGENIQENDVAIKCRTNNNLLIQLTCKLAIPCISERAINILLIVGLSQGDTERISIRNGTITSIFERTNQDPFIKENRMKSLKFIKTRCQLYYQKHQGILNNEKLKNVEPIVTTLYKSEAEVLEQTIKYIENLLTTLNNT